MGSGRRYDYWPWDWGSGELPPYIFDEWFYYGGNQYGGGYDGTDDISNTGLTFDPTRINGPISLDCIYNNLAFIRKMLSTKFWNNWANNLNMNSYISSQIKKLKEKIEEQTAGLTRIITANLNVSDINITLIDDKQSFTNMKNWIIEKLDNNFYSINLSNIDEFKIPGEYDLLIHPRIIETKIKRTNISQDFTFNQNKLIKEQQTNNTVNQQILYLQQNMFSNNGHPIYSRNELFGWTLRGTEKGTDKIIIGNMIDPQDNSNMLVVVSPSIKDQETFSDNDKIFIYNNDFIPVHINLKVTREDIDTLSYALYCKQETNCTTNKIIIYDYNDQPYKIFTCYEQSNENGNIIKVKSPVK